MVRIRRHTPARMLFRDLLSGLVYVGVCTPSTMFHSSRARIHMQSISDGFRIPTLYQLPQFTNPPYGPVDCGVAAVGGFQVCGERVTNGYLLYSEAWAKF